MCVCVGVWLFTAHKIAHLIRRYLVALSKFTYANWFNYGNECSLCSSFLFSFSFVFTVLRFISKRTWREHTILFFFHEERECSFFLYWNYTIYVHWMLRCSSSQQNAMQYQNIHKTDMIMKMTDNGEWTRAHVGKCEELFRVRRVAIRLQRRMIWKESERCIHCKLSFNLTGIWNATSITPSIECVYRCNSINLVSCWQFPIKKQLPHTFSYHQHTVSTYYLQQFHARTHAHSIKFYQILSYWTSAWFWKANTIIRHYNQVLR